MIREIKEIKVTQDQWDQLTNLQHQQVILMALQLLQDTIEVHLLKTELYFIANNFSFTLTLLYGVLGFWGTLSLHDALQI